MNKLFWSRDDIRLADLMPRFYADPLEWVKFAFPWGEAGTELESESGPDENQTGFLVDLGNEVRKRGFNGVDPVMPIRMCENSGHGTGKSAMGAWLTSWILSTRPHSMGTVSAGTYRQLESRTWAAIQRWMKLCITGHWFTIGATVVSHRGSPETWRCQAQTCKEQNAQAFAGQHAKTSTSWYMFDEASEIPDSIWDVAYGGLTDGEPMVFAWGQPSRRSGRFYQICFGTERGNWLQRSVDSRNSRFTNKQLINEWIAQYGEDSDFVRVRVRGLAPLASELQLIDAGRVALAQTRQVECLPDEPLVCGLDVARGGTDHCVFRFRRGRDARTIPAIRVAGEHARDSMRLVSEASRILSETHGPQRMKVSMMFVDETGVGGPIVDRLRQLGYTQVQGINFGAEPPDRHCANMRAYMWQRLREWLEYGAIDDSVRLETDLTGPGYMHDKHSRLVLESKEDMKKRGLDSPDDGDALALTFARHVAPIPAPREEEERRYAGAGSWMG